MTQLAPNGFAPFKEINVFWRAGGEYAPSRVSELSRTGAFIKTSRPEPAGTPVDLRLDLPGPEISVHGIVRRVVRDRGMAVEFESMSDDDRARLALVVPDGELPSLSDDAQAHPPLACRGLPPSPHRRTRRNRNAPRRGATITVSKSAHASVTNSRQQWS